jgi:hypothetical protein
MASKGHLAAAQRSEEGREECATEQAGEAQEMRRESAGGGRMVEFKLGLGLPSQSMHSKGEQGNQTMSLPVSMKRETVVGDEAGPTDKERV